MKYKRHPDPEGKIVHPAFGKISYSPRALLHLVNRRDAVPHIFFKWIAGQ